jgi:hypothetical protein
VSAVPATPHAEGNHVEFSSADERPASGGVATVVAVEAPAAAAGLRAPRQSRTAARPLRTSTRRGLSAISRSPSRRPTPARTSTTARRPSGSASPTVWSWTRRGTRSVRR